MTKLQIYQIDDKREFIQSEDKIICDGREFIVRVYEDDKTNGFVNYFMCEVSWYDFLDGGLLTGINYKDSSNIVIPSIIEGTGWTIGTINNNNAPIKSNLYCFDEFSIWSFGINFISNNFYTD